MTKTWSVSLEIGVDVIDAQHHELFDRFDAFMDALEVGGPFVQDETARALAFLDGYVKTHFADEERVMRERGYPALDRHRHMHRVFTEELASLEERHRNTGVTPSFTLAFTNLFEGWFVKHVASVDQRLGEFLAGRDAGMQV